MKKHAKIDVAALLERIKTEGADALVSRAEATALIGSRTMDAHDTLRSARNRVGIQLDRAIVLGLAGYDVFSGGIASLPGGVFAADELGRWANRRYEGKFSDMPRKPRDCNVTCRENIGLKEEVTRADLLPGDVELAHAMIMQLRAQNALAESKLLRAIEERNRALGARFAQTKK